MADVSGAEIAVFGFGRGQVRVARGQQKEPEGTGTRLSKINNFCNWLRSKGFSGALGRCAAFKAPLARSRPLRGVQSACGAFKVQSGVQSACDAFKVQGWLQSGVICYSLGGFSSFPDNR
jgi:hypothetical protein